MGLLWENDDSDLVSDLTRVCVCALTSIISLLIFLQTHSCSGRNVYVAQAKPTGHAHSQE